jgi:sulfite reductase (NADPH) hemoprotein beta-component
MIASLSDDTRTAQERLKEANPTLAGTLPTVLADPAKDHLEEDDAQFLKFHGAYQQDDRDKRKVAKHYQFMVRTKFPGGHLDADQYLVCDRLAREYGDNSLRITTRQDFQFHGIVKANLRATIRALNEALITTLAACGDVSRNVMAPPTPATGPLGEAIIDEARRLALALTPQTPAYRRIWVNGAELDLNEPQVAGFVDPLYGKTYLPRKFKIGLAIPPLNDVDIYTHDLGFVAIVEDGRLVGYNLLAGGGLGTTHGNAQTFPRLADVVGFLPPEPIEAVARAVLTIHRDFGDRTNRKHARLKYVLAERGLEWFRAQVESRAGIRLAPARPFAFTSQGDRLGWHRQADGRWFLGIFVENGRIKDRPGCALQSGLRDVVARFRPDVRLTPSQNLLLANVPEARRDELAAALAAHGIHPTNGWSKTRLASMACVALPTCGLALAESERALPGLLTRIEALQAEMGLADLELIVRMTGCPNGCARPYLAEIAFVGKAPGRYQLYLGGNEASTRLNRLHKESVRDAEIVPELRALLSRFRDERAPGERFGDWSARALWPQT